MNKKDRKLIEEVDKLEVVAEGSVEDAKQIFKEEERESEEKRNSVLEWLNTRKTLVDYNFLVADLLRKRLLYNDWKTDQGLWSFQVAPTKEGVVMEVKSPDNRMFRQAFRTVRSPMDLTAIDIFAMRAQNTVDGLSNQNSGARANQKRTSST